METVKLVESGENQTVHLPRKYRLAGSEVLIQRLGDCVILIPKEAAWQTFLNGLNSFTDDCFQDGRAQDVPSERDAL